jgi:hypothetical protein
MDASLTAVPEKIADPVPAQSVPETEAESEPVSHETSSIVREPSPVPPHTAAKPMMFAKLSQLRVTTKALATIGMVLCGIGLAALAAAWVWFLVRAFDVHIGWGLACLFVPFVPVVFLFKHWNKGGTPFLVSLGGCAGAGAGAWLLITSLASHISTPTHTAVSKLPPGVIQKGSLANEILIRDTMIGVAAKLAQFGCHNPENIKEFYVVARPTGPDGAMIWKEKWIVTGCGKEYPVNITFNQTGHHSASYTVQ